MEVSKSRKIFGLKKICEQKKNLGPKKLCFQKNWVRKNFGWKKISLPKIIKVLKKILCPKKNFGSKKNVEIEKFLGPN